MVLKKYAKIFIILTLLFPSLIFSQSVPAFRDIDCLTCHGRPDLHQIQADGLLRTLFVNPTQWSQDVHRKSGMSCIDCHVNANPIVHFREGFPKVDCARCHPEEQEEYTKNIHYEYRNLAQNRALPQCYDCHTRHSVLLHDDAQSSTHENNVGETCGRCHAEVMVKGILKGTSLGKISGHRKGDLSEKFDMKVCISCHYKDSAHGPKRAYKEFCARCHNPAKKGNAILGPTHLKSFRWTGLNSLGSGLSLFLLFGLGGYFGYHSRKKILQGAKKWLEKMKVEEVEVHDGSGPGELPDVRTGTTTDFTKEKQVEEE
jgi:hypothetical protein